MESPSMLHPLLVRRESEVHAGITFVPAARDDLSARVEAEAVFAVDVQVAEQRCFPAAETVVTDGHGNRNVDTDHADVDFALEATRRSAAARKNRGAVSVWVRADNRKRVVQRFRAHVHEDRTEDLVAVNRHARRYVVEERRADEKAAFVSGHLKIATVGEQRCTGAFT